VSDKSSTNTQETSEKSSINTHDWSEKYSINSQEMSVKSSIKCKPKKRQQIHNLRLSEKPSGNPLDNQEI